MHHALLVLRNVKVRHAGSRCELLCGVIRAERGPVVVGTQVNGLFGVVRKGSVYVHGAHVVAQVFYNVVDVVKLAAAVGAHLGRGVELAGRRDYHAVHVDVAERFLVLVYHLGVLLADGEITAVEH